MAYFWVKESPSNVINNKHGLLTISHKMEVNQYRRGPVPLRNCSCFSFFSSSFRTYMVKPTGMKEKAININSPIPTSDAFFNLQNKSTLLQPSVWINNISILQYNKISSALALGMD